MNNDVSWSRSNPPNKVKPVDYQAAWDAAVAAGKAAAEVKVPVPMVVVQRSNPLNDASPVVKVYEPIIDGVCGFAWVKVRPRSLAACAGND